MVYPPGLAESGFRTTNESERILENLGKKRMNPNPGEFGRNRGETGQKTGEFGRIWAKNGQKWAKNGRTKPKPGKTGRNRKFRRNFIRFRSSLLESRDFGRMFTPHHV